MEFIDISNWARDEHHGIFPVGARDKEMLWSPTEPIEGIKPNWPYLFKESIDRYPDQFWTEIIAFIISKHLDVDAPVVFPAKKQLAEGVCSGSLIEWFYNVDTERFLHGGVYFKRIIPEFDDRTGKQHNLRDFFAITKFLKKYANLSDEVFNWLTDMVLFDVLIGNTDRHQENWGVIFKPDNTCRLSPLFDNGTSLGHERFLKHVRDWDKQRIENYVKKGRHHIRLKNEPSNERINHFVLIKSLAQNKDHKKRMGIKLKSFNMDSMLAELEKLTLISSEVPFQPERFNWIKKILQVRYKLIQEALE